VSQGDLDGADLIESFTTGTYSIIRRAARVDDGHGRMQPGATSALSIRASVQPASGRDLLRLPEGRRSIETRVLYTTTPLLVGQQGGANEADLVQVPAADWHQDPNRAGTVLAEVQQIETWPAAVGFHRVIVQASG
jgi:hypothetical protein